MSDFPTPTIEEQQRMANGQLVADLLWAEKIHQRRPVGEIIPFGVSIQREPWVRIHFRAGVWKGSWSFPPDREPYWLWDVDVDGDGSDD